MGRPKFSIDMSVKGAKAAQQNEESESGSADTFARQELGTAFRPSTAVSLALDVAISRVIQEQQGKRDVRQLNIALAAAPADFILRLGTAAAPCGTYAVAATYAQPRLSCDFAFLARAR
ncbi:hypothetical protein AAL_02214 [Moelleriella libera RCEF 2490]|uniref:Uncharacterized protein n=1 Tax=Moelleriella libera RCEF 2490 TaxID=1081109 RepID=A0A162IX38_9HYPO|nr:hypothetical protein AAL_02214 [Moelleriella libera RCEF 2490]